MSEVWKDIKDYEGIYQVSNLGRVRRFKVGRFVPIKPWPTGNGYRMVSLSKNGERKVASVHRLVATHFVDNPNGYEYVNHINEIKDDNRASNLEFVTPKMNRNYGNAKERQIASRNANTKPKYQKVDWKGNVIAVFNGKSDFVKNGYSSKYVYLACKTNTPYRGFYWRKIVNNNH